MDESEPVDITGAYIVTDLWLHEREQIYGPIEITEGDYILTLINTCDICYNIEEY